MKLRTFYVKSYRSITEATLDNIQNYGVFVGPNNAGKSNLLRAIYISLSDETGNTLTPIGGKTTTGNEIFRLILERIRVLLPPLS